MDALAQENSSLAELIEMRYFGGMTAEETAASASAVFSSITTGGPHEFLDPWVQLHLCRPPRSGVEQVVTLKPQSNAAVRAERASVLSFFAP
ncbi:MAG: hypothetical protein ABSG03_29985 [Bryobacteraceae bacterium]|jgi:hypothetical protein